MLADGRAGVCQDVRFLGQIADEVLRQRLPSLFWLRQSVSSIQY
jgi:hypothetical protein